MAQEKRGEGWCGENKIRFKKNLEKKNPSFSQTKLLPPWKGCPPRGAVRGVLQHEAVGLQGCPHKPILADVRYEPTQGELTILYIRWTSFLARWSALNLSGFMYKSIWNWETITSLMYTSLLPYQFSSWEGWQADGFGGGCQCWFMTQPTKDINMVP